MMDYCEDTNTVKTKKKKSKFILPAPSNGPDPSVSARSLHVQIPSTWFLQSPSVDPQSRNQWLSLTCCLLFYVNIFKTSSINIPA